MLDTDNGKMVETFWLFFVMFATEGFFFAVFGKSRILLGNPDTPIERSHKKKTFGSKDTAR
jgi:hypothetical protein